jgi:hypothetical protein
MENTHHAGVELGQVVPRNSVVQLVAHRDRALELVRQAFGLLVEAEQAARAAAPHDEHAGFLTDVGRDGFYGLHWLACGEDPSNGRHADRVGELVALVQKHTDEHAWGSLVKLSGLRNLMDATAHEKMRKELSDKPPPFTVENIIGTFEDLEGRAPEIFNRSVVEVFERLDHKRYKTNSAFKITPRIVLTYVVPGGRFTHWHQKRELVGDLDRIFHVLDGKKPPAAGNFADLMAAKLEAREDVAESEYFHARMFRGNGNVHFKFKRLDLVNKANDVIAAHYGATLADGRRVA